MSTYPYADRYPVLRRFPEHGRDHESVLEELQAMAAEEDHSWERGRASGSFYCGDKDHYAFMGEAFALYGHVNALQRDICPSATRFEGEIIAMGLDLMHADDARARGSDPVGLLTSGGSGSILHAMVSYREAGRARGISAPNIVKPETAHPAFDKACWLLGIEVRTVPANPDDTLADVAAMSTRIDANTVALIGSAGNYPYGTVDPIGQMGTLAQAHNIGLHVDGCLGGFILPFGEMLGVDIPIFDFRIPGVTTISADTHKYGYSVKGTSILLFRDRSLRNAQYYFNTEWSGGKYCSPGIDGSRSVGLLAATWASMVTLGKQGYLDRARRIFDTSFAMQDAVRSHDELRLMGRPTFCFSFTSGVFDVYHVNDSMRAKGWRLNGQQHPGALHMAVTGPQTQAGVVEDFTLDLAAAVAYANEHKGQVARSSGVYAGADIEGQQAWDSKVRGIMETMMDHFLEVPTEAAR